MRWVTCVAAPILLADIGDHCFGVFSLDLKRGDERIFGVHGNVVRLPFQFKPDGELHPHASSSHYFGADHILAHSASLCSDSARRFGAREIDTPGERSHYGTLDMRLLVARR